MPYGGRDNAKCQACGSLERHRLLWLYLQRKTDFFEAPLRVLHFSPRACFQERFRALENLDYNTADMSEGCDLRFDIQDIRGDVGTFDVILAVHVLEHVPDDRKAMREIRRILNPGGWAILQVPIFPLVLPSGPLIPVTTIEDKNITTPEERLKHYGHPEHLRAYGEDYFERLFKSGFRVSTMHADAILTGDEMGRYRTSFENIYRCGRAA